MLRKFIGNSSTLEILLNMLEKGNLPHAIMLEGDDGLGKHTLALALSKAILCDNSAEGCENCRSCTLFSAGTHPDFSVISQNGNNLIKVDDIRSLRKKAFERPDRGNKKIYLIENAHCMNREAQNAFLKILEEPPEYVIFILLAVSSSAFLDTVVSRCTVFRITPPSYGEAFQFIKDRFPEKSDEEIDQAILECDINIGKVIAHLQNEEASEIYRTAAELMVLIGGRRAYDTLKVLHKFEWDSAGLQSLISTLSSRASQELRNLAMGKPGRHTLSRKDLVNIIESLEEASAYLKQKVATPIVITRLCSALIS